MNTSKPNVETAQLGEMYDVAFREWAESEDSQLWDALADDGLDSEDCSGFDDVEAGFEGVDIAEDGQ